MTDQFAALAVLANVNAADCPEREQALAEFYATLAARSAGRRQMAGRAIRQPPPDTLATVRR
jgi:aminopeptidase N